MNKKISALILTVSILLALFIYGCCSHSKEGFFVNPQGDAVITSREIIIDELGRLPTVTFPSGAKIEGLEENTLTPGIVVTIVEQKMVSQNASLFNSSSNSDVYLYKITAFMNPTNSVGAKTYVTTTEKPIKITLPRPQNSQNIILAGIKESDTDPWRLFNFSDSDELMANIADVRTVGTNISDNTFSLFRLGTQFALVSYGNSTGNRLPETYVTSLNATSTASILVKDGRYQEDLSIRAIMKGTKLGSLNSSDLRARITYRNNQADEAPIKVNGVNVTQTSKADKTVPGYTYYHSFLVDSISDYGLNGVSGEYCFTLNLNGVDFDSFPTGFLIEFFNKINGEKILPYNYTEFYTISRKEVKNVSVTPDNGKLDDGSGRYELAPTFTISIGTELSDNDKKKIESAISVTNVEPEKITKNWNGDVLTIGFAEELEPDTSYVLTIADVTDIEGISLTDVADFTFITGSDNRTAGLFTIVYDLDGGTIVETNPTKYGEASETFVLKEPAKEGYSFIGWTGSNGDTPQLDVSIQQGSTGDKSFTANYTPVNYSITYELNGGQPAGENPETYDITSATITLHNPTKDGYAFIGWTGSNGDELQLTATIETGSIGDKKFVANYTAVDYTISYILGADNVVNNNPTGYNTASETFALIEPTREGYTFTGWTGTGLDAASMTLTIPQGSTGNREYTANWSINSYRLDLIAGTGIATVDGAGIKEYNSIVTASCTMLAGYEFDSWTGDFTIETFSMPADNATMTASAKLITYTIVYDFNGGNEVANPENFDVTSATIDIVNPSRTGYSFAGWTGTGLDAASMTLTIPQGSTNNRTYTANWNINSYRLDLIAGTGVATVEGAGMKEYNSEVIATCTFNLGYEFDSWSGDFTTEIFNMPANNATMTANAKPIIYTINYILDNGSTTNPLTYDITSATIDLSIPNKEGYTFTGWSGTGLTGEDNMTVTIPQGSTGSREYTAHWSINTYRLDLIAGANVSSVTGAGDYQYGVNIEATCTYELGYEFDSWTGDITTGTFNMPAQNATMTANVKLINYTITYDLNGGTLAEGDSNPEYYNITSSTIMLNNPTKAGTYFMGWTCEEYFGASMSVKIPQGSTGNKSYTANWGEILTFTLSNEVELVMHKIPAGSFERPENSNSPNGTKQIITISKAFYIGKFEVTQDQYFAVMGTNPSYCKEGSSAAVRPTTSANYPVELLSWDTIASGSECFLEKINTQLAGQLPAGYRFALPTEAQWEYACRAGTNTDYNNGTNATGDTPDTNLDNLGWYSSNAVGKSHDVGSKTSNAWWLYDMHGNVYEWCFDLYGSYYTGNLTDPVGLDDGTTRVLRSGCWGFASGNTYSWRRHYGLPTITNIYYGFRLALEKIPEP